MLKCFGRPWLWDEFVLSFIKKKKRSASKGWGSTLGRGTQREAGGSTGLASRELLPVSVQTAAEQQEWAPALQGWQDQDAAKTLDSF